MDNNDNGKPEGNSPSCCDRDPKLCCGDPKLCCGNCDKTQEEKDQSGPENEARDETQNKPNCEQNDKNDNNTVGSDDNTVGSDGTQDGAADENADDPGHTDDSVVLEDDTDTSADEPHEYDKFCLPNCLHGRNEGVKDKYMECCLCAKLFHIECVGVSPMDSKKVKFWPCPGCRKMSHNVRQIEKSIADLTSVLDRLSHSIADLSSKHTLKGDIDRSHSLELLASKIEECENLKA